LTKARYSEICIHFLRVGGAVIWRCCHVCLCSLVVNSVPHVPEFPVRSPSRATMSIGTGKPGFASGKAGQRRPRQYAGTSCDMSSFLSPWSSLGKTTFSAGGLGGGRASLCHAERRRVSFPTASSSVSCVQNVSRTYRFFSIAWPDCAPEVFRPLVHHKRPMRAAYQTAPRRAKKAALTLERGGDTFQIY
jgi:hypothetical protein